MSAEAARKRKRGPSLSEQRLEEQREELRAAAAKQQANAAKRAERESDKKKAAADAEKLKRMPMAQRMKIADAKMAASFPVDPRPKTAPGIAAGKKWVYHESMGSFMDGVYKRQQGSQFTVKHVTSGGNVKYKQCLALPGAGGGTFTTLPKPKSGARAAEKEAWHKANTFACHAEFVLCRCGEWVPHDGLTGMPRQGHDRSKRHQAWSVAYFGNLGLR